MRIIDPILQEFRDEVPATRRLLERVPSDKLAWKPHQKSRSLGELATHIASLPAMAQRIATSDEFSAGTVQAPPANSADEIRSIFENNVRTAEEALSHLEDEAALGNWRLVFRGKEVFRLPRVAALRKVLLNHIYHHRGQLSVYLRLLDAPVPSVYGPTADDNPVM